MDAKTIVAVVLVAFIVRQHKIFTVIYLMMYKRALPMI